MVCRLLVPAAFALAGLAACAAGPQVANDAQRAAVRRLHGHNDYLQPVPLRRALELGLGSVEADVFLVDGELRVGHEPWQLRPGRTLRSLYLAPLEAWAAARGGRVCDDGAPFVLLVDIKTDAAAIWPVLHDELRAFAPVLTRFTAGGVEPGAVTVLLSGNRPRAAVAAAAERWCALDGRLADLDLVPAPAPELMPWISDRWSRVADGTGADGLLPAERERIAELVARARAQGRALRFWGVPDRAEIWQELFRLGVDRIGTDRPRDAAAVLRSLAASP